MSDLPCVLLADDDPAVQVSLAMAFSALGWETVAARSAEETLAKLKERRYDLIIFDLRMPDMNGLDLIRLIQAENPNRSPVRFVFSGYVTKADRTALLAEGIQAILQKPLQLRQLAEALKEHNLPCKKL
jgi:CheY-like chemotaxis protein